MIQGKYENMSLALVSLDFNHLKISDFIYNNSQVLSWQQKISARQMVYAKGH